VFYILDDSGFLSGDTAKYKIHVPAEVFDEYRTDPL
jgi:hypothetical protein